jgi:hypothetical protein
MNPPDDAHVRRCSFCGRAIVVWGDDVVGIRVNICCAECLAKVGNERWLLVAHEHDAIVADRLDDLYQDRSNGPIESDDAS